MNFCKTTDSKREEFRKYLERAGVMDIITKAMVNLYREKERPEDPLEYVIAALNGAAQSRNNDVICEMEEKWDENYNEEQDNRKEDQSA